MDDVEVISLVDAHCHLDLYKDPEATVTAALAKGVRAIITAGVHMESSNRIGKLTELPGVFGVVGVHPDEIPKDGFVEELERLMRANKRIVGIGEIGLDAKSVERVGAEAQERVFSQQLDLAVKCKVPVVIHVRGMLDRAVELLNEKGIERAMFHFFSGNEEDAARLEKRGHLMSIPPLESGRLKRVIKSVDIGSLVTETDGPVVGKEPSDVRATLQRISEFKGIALEEASASITETLKDYFGLRI